MILQRFIFNKLKISQLRRGWICNGFASDASSDFWRHKSSYRWFLPVQTRWKDNDQYLHMNNAVYHAIFDSVINVFLIRRLGLDTLDTTTPRGFMVTNSCTFSGSCSYPNVYMAGLAVSKLGNTSVRYRLALFPLSSPSLPFPCDLVQGHGPGDQEVQGVAEEALVTGDSTHVFVDPGSRRSTPLSPEWREGLGRLVVRETEA